MSHYFESGFSVRQPAWHGLGEVLADYPGNWDEARRLAGLDWEPVKVPTYEFHGITADGTPTHDAETAITGAYSADPERSRVIRNDTGATLAVANDTYELISHAEMGEVVETLLDNPTVKYETAGVLEAGRAVWALALLDEPVQLAGRYGKDESQTLPYLAVLNRHDGGAAFRVTSTTVRIVCANTFRAAEAEGERTDTTFSFRHTKNWRDRIEEARKVISGVRDDFAEYVQTATDLLDIPVNSAQRELFVRRFFPMPPEHLISDRVVRNVEQARTAIRAILASRTSEGIDGTAFGLMQAAGEYADHARSAKSPETRLGRSILRPEPAKVRAANLVREVAGIEVTHGQLIGLR